ncbi:MAG: hypothetical protein ACRC3Y_02935 [Romboutsia sp.]|uniref:hypothetical protein n=1 Tax=Romboutsia sp. TaxID=1965302 RepID=UPI003F388CE0
MNKRKTIYRGFNKRRKTKHIQIIIITASVCLVCGYGIYKIKESSIFETVSRKISSLSLDEIIKKEDVFLGYDDFDIEKENDSKDASAEDEVSKEETKKIEEPVEDKKKTETNQKIELAKVDPWSIYTIQVASVSNDKDMNKIETQLVDSKIPFSIVEIEGSKKVQTHASFDKEVTRKYIEEIKEIFPDAFISEMKVPVLAIEYIDKDSYVESITNELNNLIKNFEQESVFWDKDKKNIDLKEYNSILTNRKNIIDNIKNETKKIDYQEMNVFKENLIDYTNSIDKKIDMASKSANEQNYIISESLHLSSMQEYFSFINSIKKA